MGGAGKLLGLLNCLWYCSAKTVAASLPTTTSPTSFSICLGLSDSLPKNLLKIAHALRGLPSSLLLPDADPHLFSHFVTPSIYP
eukprot:g19756.t1